MTSQIGFLGYLLVQLLVIGMVFVALCDAMQRVFGFNNLLTLSAAVLALGLIGYGSFWLGYANYAVFAFCKIVCLAGFVVYFGWIVCRRELARLAWLVEPLLPVFLLMIAVVALGFSNGNLNDPALAAQTRFMEWLPPDDILPMMVADWLRAGRVAVSPLGEWLTSDRPPLQTGLYLLLALKFHEIGYQIVASWLQATFLLGVWALGIAAGLPAAARRMVMLACCVLPITILNTLYVWPKLLPVGHLMFVFALVFCCSPREPREQTAVGVLAGGMAALALLSHGAGAFALLGFAIVAIAAWHWPSWRTAAAAVVTLLLLYAPWMAYQRFLDPPGNRLMKWHLAGVAAFDPRGVLETLQQSYSALTWHDYVGGRLANFATMIGDWPRHLRDIGRLAFDHDPALAGAVRHADFFQLLPSLHVYSLALIAAIALLPLMEPHNRRIAMRLLMAFAATVLVVAVLVFTPGQTINHVNPYVLPILAVAFAFVVLAVRAPVLGLILIALQSATVVTAYGLHGRP